MDPAHYGLIEMVLVFGFVLALAIYELVSVRRQLGRDAASRSSESDPARQKRDEATSKAHDENLA